MVDRHCTLSFNFGEQPHVLSTLDFRILQRHTFIFSSYMLYENSLEKMNILEATLYKIVSSLLFKFFIRFVVIDI